MKVSSLFFFKCNFFECLLILFHFLLIKLHVTQGFWFFHSFMQILKSVVILVCHFTKLSFTFIKSQPLSFHKHLSIFVKRFSLFIPKFFLFLFKWPPKTPWSNFLVSFTRAFQWKIAIDLFCKRKNA